MTILVTSDLHLSHNPRDAYRWAIFPYLRKVIEEHKVDELFILGDLTEAKDRHPAALVNRIVDELTKLNMVDMTILRGNHDGQTPDDPYFHFIRHIPYINWIQKPLKLENYLFLPYTPTPEKDWKGISYAGVSTIFCHQHFTGARADASQLVIPGGVAPDLLPAKVRILAGDIHHPQQLGSIIYVGAPYTIDWGDDYNGRVLLLDGYSTTYLPTELPCKRLLVDGKGTSYTGDLVKLQVTLKAEDFADWRDISNDWRAWAEKQGLVVQQIVPIIKDTRIRRIKMQRAHLSDGELLASYGKARGLSRAILAKGRTLL
jgi:DNA repair exonuclease SbcCD nuclease subunit